MSRASELTLFIILLQGAIGFVDGTGMFTEHYMAVPNNNASYVISDLEPYFDETQDKGLIGNMQSQVDLYLNWAWESFFIGLKILGAVLFVLPSLIDDFGIPEVLAIFMQLGVYYVYATWYAQYKSGKGWKYYE